MRSEGLWSHYILCNPTVRSELPLLDCVQMLLPDSFLTVTGALHHLHYVGSGSFPV